jgi:hypothetical protein
MEETLVVSPEYYPGIFLEGLGKSYKTFQER